MTVLQNERIAAGVYRMRLGGSHNTARPGQFVQIKLDGFYLRRPISVCDWDEEGLTIIYKAVGEGTRAMAELTTGTALDMLSGLGNGYDITRGERPLLVGGGVGVPPLYGLAKQLRAAKKPVIALLGFGSDEDVFYEHDFAELGCDVIVTTMRAGQYHQGLVTDHLPGSARYDCYYTCGPEPMLRALHEVCAAPGQLSFESRMACGFGACMGCSCKTKYGSKRICKDGPVLESGEVIW